MTLRRLAHATFFALLFVIVFTIPVAAQAAPVWVEPDGEGGSAVNLYVFHSLTCPHCQAAMPFLDEMAAQNPWLRLHTFEVSGSQQNATRYVEFAAALGQEAMYVPAFFFCGQMVSGYDNAEGVGARLSDALSACHAEAVARAAPAGDAAPLAVGAAAGAGIGEAAAVKATPESIALPIVGEVAVGALSLPVLTMAIAGLDAFNPCAFFVLMFLLSLMVHAGSRRRMLLVGGVFVLFSALVYFVFMSAWLNVFLWLGELKIITMVAGLVAVALALINIKDFFWFKRGVSLSIPEGAKPGLFARMRGTVSAGSLPAMLGSTILLALAANSYELLCTSGFPMVYTRALTLHDLPTGAYYGYLAAYNVIYVLPLLVIVTLFAARFGARKLQENEGRSLKLISGVMMLMLGLVLVIAPAWLGNPVAALGMLAAALAASLAIIYIDRRRNPAPDRGAASPAGRTGKGPHARAHR